MKTLSRGCLRIGPPNLVKRVEIMCLNIAGSKCFRSFIIKKAFGQVANWTLPPSQRNKATHCYRPIPLFSPPKDKAGHASSFRRISIHSACVSDAVMRNVALRDVLRRVRIVLCTHISLCKRSGGERASLLEGGRHPAWCGVPTGPLAHWASPDSPHSPVAPPPRPTPHADGLTPRNPRYLHSPQASQDVENAALVA